MIDVWDLIANILVTVAWLGCSLFIKDYLTGPWRLTLPGRTLMYSKLSMWALLTYVLWARWLDPPDLIRNLAAAAILLTIAGIQWRLWWTLRLVRRGKISLDQWNYTPIRDWLARRRDRRRVRTED